jgi:DNA invertase Pin-like site-specific DNA recombinase
VSTYLVYVRRSYKTASAADVSDETQEAVARSLIPPGANVEVIRDSGGHNSGATDGREGYQLLLRRLRDGDVTGVAVYDLSRLARTVRLMANLRDELERRQIALLAGNLPNSRFDTAVGRFMFNMLVSAAQFQRDNDSERMKAMMRRTFEDGGHRGNDPFGYRTARDVDGKIVHPRTLEIVEDEAEVVRRVFRELARRPFSEIADRLNAETVPHRAVRAWTKNAVKDLWRRREVYRGNVTSRRGVEVIAGKHPPILTPEEFRDACAGVERRIHRRGVRQAQAKRFYLLGGLVYCSCGTKMHGTAQKNRGKEWLYYVCPVAERRRAVLDADGNLIVCNARRVRAGDADGFVTDALHRFRLPDEALEEVRAELFRRRKADKPGDLDRQRERLRRSEAALLEQHRHGYIDDEQLHREMTTVRRQLAALPSPDDKLVLFDRYRAEVKSFAEALDAAAPEKLRELVALLVERVETDARAVARVMWTGPARPFFVATAAEAAERAVWGVAPPDGFEPPTPALGRPRSIH